MVWGCCQLCGDPQLWDVPVILLSARAGEEARAEGSKPAPMTIW
jgi:hypothetical protein